MGSKPAVGVVAGDARRACLRRRLILVAGVLSLALVFVQPAMATTSASAVSAGGSGESTCAVTSGGAAECWGANNDGQLGNGTTTISSTPVAVTGLSNGVAALSAGGDHACAVTTAGAAECWGNNASGQLGNGTTTSSSTPVAVTGLSSGVAAISAGAFHTCALTSGGAVECWGDNFNGQLGDGSTTNSSTPVAVSGLTSGVVAIAAGDFQTCALTSGGAAECWGQNNHGQLGDGTTTDSSTPVAVSGLTNGAEAIVGGAAFSCAVTSAGAAECWGNNQHGELGDGSTTDSSTPVAVSGLSSGVSAIAGGLAYTCAVVNGGAECWGENIDGQLGNGTMTNSATPVAVSGLSSGAVAVVAGFVQTCALTSSGAVECWGGPPANGSTTESDTPLFVPGFAGRPGASISAPATGGIYAIGQSVATSFSCSEGGGGPGLSSCDDNTGTDTVNGGPGQLDTSTTGQHTYTVTATSSDGLVGTGSISYTVAGAPTASISSPAAGANYALGEVVRTSFSCTEGTSGPGLASCDDSTGTDTVNGDSGQLDTATSGQHSYTVTAVSRDGQRGSTTISYTVAPPAAPPRPTPRLRGLKLTPRAFRAATRGPTVGGRSDSGTAIRYSDTLAARTTFRVLRCAGRRGRCTKLVPVGSFSHPDRAGKNRLRFSGRLHGRRLGAGHYMLRATATLAGQKGRTLTVRFQVLAPPVLCGDPDNDGDCDMPGQD